MKRIRIASVLFVMLAASTAATMAWGKINGDGEALALAKAKIPLTQAIDNALVAVPGQALSAELDDERNTPVFVVEVASKGQTYEVALDTQTGKVISKKLDSEDNEDHRDGKKDRD
ncbi:MAG: PepSY domain-containing protein [Desulfurivibrionaceae bacterium]